MNSVNYEGIVLKHLNGWGWGIKGTLDDVLELRKNPVNSKLMALLGVVNLKDGAYAMIGTLDSPDIERIVKIGYKGTKNVILQHLREVIAHYFEPYFTGLTNVKEIKEIHERYKIR